MTQLLRPGRVSIPEGVMVRRLGEESVLLNLNSESYFGLDDTGTQMWAALTDSVSIRTAFEQLLSEFEVEPEQLQADLADFVDALLEIGLINVVEE
jgi:hypothetical protein